MGDECRALGRVVPIAGVHLEPGGTDHPELDGLAGPLSSDCGAPFRVQSERADHLSNFGPSPVGTEGCSQSHRLKHI